jgi:hypothetical protein
MAKSTDIQDLSYHALATYDLADVLGELGILLVRLGFVSDGAAVARMGDEIVLRARAAASDNIPPLPPLVGRCSHV